MGRRTPRLSFLAGVISVALATAYGCGGGDSPLASLDEDGSTPEASSPPPEGDGSSSSDAAIAPDVRDGSVTKDGGAESGSDSGAVDSGDSGIVVPPPGPLAVDYVDYDVNHILSTGQSNATANSANPVLSTMQPYTNIMFNGGPMVGASPTSFVPLREGDNNVETIASGMANRITSFALDSYEFNVRPGYPTKHDVLVSNHARSGWTYWCLRKGGCSYQGGGAPWLEAVGQVTIGKQLANAAGLTYAVRAVTAIHGESDHTGYVTNRAEVPIDGSDGTFQKIKDYSDGLLEWQADYEAMAQGITGQADGVPLFVSQISGWNNARYSKVAQYQYVAHKRAPGKVVLVTAGYPFSFRSDCLHFTAVSQRRLGEYFAKVYAKVIFERTAWEPVRPKLITRAGNVVTVQYHVPAPPLVIDTVRVSNPGSFGFEFLDDNGATPITNVAVTAADTVTITLAATPAGANKRLLYAQNQTPSTCVGPGTDGQMGGARGNLRDSDGTPSLYGNELFNWGVLFDEAVP